MRDRAARLGRGAVGDFCWRVTGHPELNLTTDLSVGEAVTEGFATSVGLAQGNIQKPDTQHSVGGAATDGDATDHYVGVEASDGDATSVGAAQGDIQKPDNDHLVGDAVIEGVATSVGVAQGTSRTRPLASWWARRSLTAMQTLLA